jgi:hypothetical protein
VSIDEQRALTLNKAQRADCRLLKLHATPNQLIHVGGFLSVATRLQTTAAIHHAVVQLKELGYGGFPIACP